MRKQTRNWLSQGSIVVLFGCTNIEVPPEGTDTKMDEGMGSGGTVGSGGSGSGTGGGLVGHTGGSSASGGASTGGPSSTGGAGSGGAGSGGVGTGGAGTGGVGAGTGGAGTGGVTPGGPAYCLADWDLTHASTCENATPKPWAPLGCRNALNCWRDNNCAPSECSQSSDDICGEDNVEHYEDGLSAAMTVFDALCN